MKYLFQLALILALYYAANHLVPGPGEADVRGKARIVGENNKHYP